MLKDFSGDTASGETTDGRSPDDWEAMAVFIAVGIWETHSHLETEQLEDFSGDTAPGETTDGMSSSAHSRLSGCG